jgi:uncharacterized protein HemX
MKRNIGELSWTLFLAGLLAFLAIGVGLYLQFEFKQQQRPEDATRTGIVGLQNAEREARSEVQILTNRVQKLEASQKELIDRVERLHAKGVGGSRLKADPTGRQ